MTIKTTTITSLCAVLFITISTGCNQTGQRNNSETDNNPTISNLAIADFDSLQYQKFQQFDLYTLTESGEAIDTPFVYVKRDSLSITLRISNDLKKPYIFKNHGDYWHMRRDYNTDKEWHSDELSSENIKTVDFFIKNDTVYEFIQGYDEDSVRYNLVIATKHKNFWFILGAFNLGVPFSDLLFNYVFQLTNSIYDCDIKSRLNDVPWLEDHRVVSQKRIIKGDSTYVFNIVYERLDTKYQTQRPINEEFSDESIGGFFY